jgi:hypothetical protein
MVCVSVALTFAGASPAFAGTADAPGQINGAANCSSGPVQGSGSPSTGGGCYGHFHQT